VAPDRLGRGLSALVLRAMKAAAVGAGLSALVVPVRPTAKSVFPTFDRLLSFVLVMAMIGSHDHSRDPCS
jgi:hypothetical protein